VVKPLLDAKFDWVEVRPFAQLKADKVTAFIRSINAMNASYILVCDGNGAPCVSQKKQKLQALYPNVQPEKIVVVVHEIESWYLAGVSHPATKKLCTQAVGKTDDLTKEQFDSLMPSRFDSRIDWMVEILGAYSIAGARLNNQSFDYFISKFDLLDVQE
jgi:hypothetical protein